MATIELGPEDGHVDIVAAIAALGWVDRQRLIAAAFHQWSVDYTGRPPEEKPSGQPKRRTDAVLR